MRTNSILIIGLIIVAIGFSPFLGSGKKPGSDEASSGLIISNNAIYVAEQAPGLDVLVSVVRLDKPGFVAIHEDKSGAPGTILGVSNLLPAGEMENLPITLSEPTLDGGTIYAMIYFDNGDGKFDITNDKPVQDLVGGKPMMMVVTVSKDATEPGIVIP